MKHLFILVFGVVFSLVSMADSILLVKTEYVNKPISAGFNLNTDRVMILATGQVNGYRYAPNGDLVFSKTLATLNARGLSRIDLLVERARKGETINPEIGGVQCKALPVREEVFTAEGQGLLLEDRTSPCGVVTYNDTRSSLELINQLKYYADVFAKAAEGK